MREPGNCATYGGSESRDKAKASAWPAFIIAIASPIEATAWIVVFFNDRPAARMVVVLAMPMTRTPGRST